MVEDLEWDACLRLGVSFMEKTCHDRILEWKILFWTTSVGDRKVEMAGIEVVRR